MNDPAGSELLEPRGIKACQIKKVTALHGGRTVVCFSVGTTECFSVAIAPGFYIEPRYISLHSWA